MSDVRIFQRVEKKYLITPEKKELLLSMMEGRLESDPHGRYTICSLYLDTPDFRIIRRSLEGEVYKEKLRIRSYGTPDSDSSVFFELKKKYKGTVYKRREVMSLRDAKSYIDTGVSPLKSQIMGEIDYVMNFYASPEPVMIVAYERDAYFAPNDENLRITFDTGVRYRTDNLDLSLGTFGKRILDDSTVIMEIKTDGAMPLWLARILSESRTYPSRFSKYGRSYIDMLENNKGEALYVTDHETDRRW